MTIKYDDFYIREKLNSFLIGSKLGDGSFIQRTPRHNLYITFKHAVSQFEYLNWKYRFLEKYGLLKNKEIKKRNFTTGKMPNWKDQYYFSTISLKEFNKYNQFSIEELINQLDEFSLSIWILDDGNFDKKTCKIACGRFSENEKLKAINILKSRFNIDAFEYVNKNDGKKGYIRIPSREYKKIEKIILRNVPNELDIIKSKLGIDKESEILYIKYLSKDHIPLSYIGGKSNWIDLRSSETIEMKAGEWRLIPLGIAVRLPYGYEAHIVPRSSTFKNFGLIQANHFGIVDNSYNSNEDQWYFSAYATRDTKIEKNDRICQFRIMKIQPQLTFEETEDLGNNVRGGFGSTGIK